MELTLESALSPEGLFGHTSYILLVISMMMRRMVWLRIMVILSAIVGITYASVVLSDPVGTFWETLLVLVNIVQLAITWHQNRSAQFSDEERAFMDGHLPSLSMAQRRRLLNHGMWISGDKNTQLTEEGEPVSHLIYLADGQALVSSGGKPVAVCEPGAFIGEMTALHGDPANGTVKLIRDSRYWAIEAQQLRDLVGKDGEIANALESSFARNMRDKLVRSNRFILESGGVRKPSPPGRPA
jgi:CRP-like cAMP-binding protein